MRQIFSRWLSSGLGKVMEKRMRHEKASSTRLQVSRQDRQALIGLQALEQVVHLDVGVPVVAVPHLATFAKKGIGFIEEEDRPTVFRCVEELAQIFSVSPMYLLTTAERSMRYRLRLR